MPFPAKAPHPAYKRICIFCASSQEGDEKYFTLARAVGALCAQLGLSVVYGGAQKGLMGAMADAALAQGGEVIGVMPEILLPAERAHKNLTRMHITADMHERQKTMADLADIFLILPGGLGTLAEFFEIVTWKQIGLHEKPILVLNADGFWNSLLDLLLHCEKERFLHHKSADLYHICQTVKDVESFLCD